MRVWLRWWSKRRKSKSRLQHTVDRYRADLRSHESQAEQALESAYAHVLKTLQPTLDRLYKQMADKMANGEKIPPSWLYEANRLESIKSLIENQINHFGTLSRIHVAQAQHWAAQLGQESAQEMLHATVPAGVRWTFGVPSPAAVANIVGATQSGSPLADLFDGFGREAADLASKALIRGITLGSNPRAVASDIQQALGVSRNRALVISRQEMLRSYKTMNTETYRANSDVVDQWRWTADKSGHTCAMCIAMDGSLHDLSEDLDSHVQCRCVPTPVTKSWDDILSGLGIDTSNILESGQYDYESGPDWFANQDAATQQSILGSKAAYDLYKSGTPLSAFVGTSHDPDWGRSRYQKSAKQVASK